MQLRNLLWRHSVAMWLLLQSLVLITFCFNSATTCPKLESCYCQDPDKHIIRCSRMKLKEVPKDIPNNTRVLFLDYNEITSVPNDAFKDLHHLVELNLSNNLIHKLETHAFRGLNESLTVLSLSNNKLQTVKGEVFNKLKADITLSNNPWLCDCTLQNMIKELSVKTVASNDIICASAAQEEFVGKPFLEAAHKVNFCNIHKKTTDVAMLVTMFGWFTMVISYLVYYVRQNQEDARRHLEYLKSLPSKQSKSEASSTISTVV
ncbi:leucine-rich repeat-containing protein 3B isoform X1 [Callorhinchus milii]|uniref:leucine-rich repeat-containing protein 3B isoform X1 n=1 Tax=Callorhinchus milii TaxID=7868 RepID=UPI00045755ED|nr:leucine-rich repeat-containing protein 3B isoform X1 [Callorhinchus milii]|eukprot:gi/632981449/ref/XP_007907598.1/ PREDICTED: leucine-rich repeat-containing protein 3C isoform X1 [Callorhinchus milii]